MLRWYLSVVYYFRYYGYLSIKDKLFIPGSQGFIHNGKIALDFSLILAFANAIATELMGR